MKRIYQRFIAMLIVVSIAMSTVLPTRNITYAAVNESKETANLFERAIAAFMVTGTLGLYALIGIAAGSAEADDGSAAPLTVEALFFNRYPKTRLALFGDSAGTNDYITTEFKTTINDFFSFFTKIAVIVYMTMLVYIGIRILLNAGTQKNAKYKEFLVYWVQGVAILFLFPYVMKYTIMINNAFVEFIDDNKENIFAIGDAIEPAGIVSQEGSDMSDVENTMDSAQATLESGTDYMSVMFVKAWTEGWIVYALCWIIMVKQLLSLLIIYFKRLLITIFLIVIFPLVTISYAIDKLGDGKSQAFGNWCKEFILNVFIQSFHAIVYVIGMALIVRLGEEGNVTENWLLILILITFISKGDDLLKNIFNVKGGGGETVKGVAQTMLEARGAIKLAENVGGAVSKTVGSNSRLAEVGRGVGRFVDHGKDYMTAQTLASNAAMQDEFMPAVVPMTSQQAFTSNMVDPASIQSNLSEERKQEILDKMLNIMDIQDEGEREKALESFKQELEEDQDALQFVEALLQVNQGGAVAAVVNGELPVELNERIEVILEQMRNGKLARNKELINKLRMASAVRFKRPEQSVLSSLRGRSANTGTPVGSKKNGGTRKPGNRYSGTFKPGMQASKMNQARNAAKAGPAGVKPGMRFSQRLGDATGRAIKQGRATRDIMGLERTAIKDLRAINKLQKQLRNKNLSAVERKRLEEQIRKINSKGNMQALKDRRAYYAKNGVYFATIGRSQRFVNAQARNNKFRQDALNVGSNVKKGAVNTKNAVAHPIKTFKAASKAVSKKLQPTRNANAAAREAVKLKEKRLKGQLTHQETQRLYELEKVVGDYGRQKRSDRRNGPQRMTRAERRLNMGTNRVAVQEARNALTMRREADKLRSQGKTKEANKLDLQATHLEKRVVRTRGMAVAGSTKLRKATRAQRILDKGHQKYSVEKLKAIRSKDPSKLSEAEKKILDNSNKLRQEMRRNGVVLRGASRVEAHVNKPTRMTKKQELQALGTIAGARVTTAAKMVNDRVLHNRVGDYSQEQRRVQETSDNLRKRGIVIRESRFVGAVDRKTSSIQNRRDTADDRRAARTAAAEESKKAFAKKKSLDRRRKNAASELEQARADVRRAGNDAVARKKAQSREQAAIKNLGSIQRESDALLTQTKARRQELRSKGVVLSVGGMRSSILENKMSKEASRDYQSALRAERSAERKLERANLRVERIERAERKQERTDRIIDGATKIKLTPVRKLAEAAQTRREETKQARENSFATKMGDALTRQQRAQEGSEAAALFRSVSQETVHSNNIASGPNWGNRVADSASQKFHAFATGFDQRAASKEARVARRDEAIVTGYNVAKDAVKTVVDSDRRSQAVEQVKGAIKKEQTDFLTALQDGLKLQNGDTSSGSSAGVFSQEVLTDCGRRTENRTKITGMYTPPKEETSSPATPSSKGSTHSNERETVVVIRDSEDSYIGPLADKNVISVNSQRDYDRAKRMVDEARAAVSASSSNSDASNNSGNDGPTMTEKLGRQAVVLAASIVAINQSDSGDYTASEIVAHIDNIKAIMKEYSPGTPEYDVCANLLTKLKYNLDDYESNVRIQVLNDPSLIDNADPNRERIIDSSISHVKSLPSDEVLLSMLRYEPGDLQEGYTPIARTAKTYHSIDSFVATGIATGYDESELRTSFSESLRERNLQEQQAAAEKAMDASRKAMGQDLLSIGKNAVGAAVDLSVGAPLALGAGLIGAGMGSANKKDGLVTLQSATSAFAGYSIGDKAYQGAKNFVSNRVDDGVHAVSDTFQAALNASKKGSDSSKK